MNSGSCSQMTTLCKYAIPSFAPYTCIPDVDVCTTVFCLPLAQRLASFRALSSSKGLMSVAGLEMVSKKPTFCQASLAQLSALFFARPVR